MIPTKMPLSFWEKIKFRNWRIFTKFMVVLLVLAIAPLLAVTFFGGQVTRDVLIKQEEANVAHLAHSIAQRIEQLLGDNHNIISMVARDRSVITLISQAANDSVEDEVLDAVNYTIDNTLQSNSTVELVSVFDSEGYVLAHSKKNLIGTGWSFRHYFQQAIQGNRYLSGILIGTAANTPGIFGSAPVYSKDGGDVIGVVSTKIKGDYVTDILASSLLSPKEGLSAEELSAIEIYLINEYGIVMAHSDPDSEWLFNSFGTVTEEALENVLSDKMLGGDCPENADTCTDEEKIPRSPQPMPALQSLADVMLAEMAAGASGYSQYCLPADVSTASSTGDSDCSGQWHTIGYAAVTNPVSVEDSIFMVIVDVPYDVILSEINALVRTAQLATIGLAVFVILVALVVTRTLSRPIGRLSNAAQDVENDQPFDPADISEVTALGDEIGYLARVFSSMVLALRARMAELQTIYEIGQKISSSVDLTETLSDVVDSLGKVIAFDAAEICLYDDHTKELALYVTNTGVVSVDDTVPKITYSRKKDYFPRLFAERGAILVENVEAYKDHKLTIRRTWNAFDPKSYLGVSLRNRDRVVGAIELISDQVNGFNEDNRRILESISIQAAVAISNAQEVRDRERRIMNMEIAVDETRVDEEVSTITNSGFFKSLKKKIRTRSSPNI
ncbi:MAG: HAMP domain-containing protein [Chloroflexi bacterium]|nr:HAMP domain-containing protein [Chloroflexota bacterium]